jgi:hypothetical protein
MIFLLLHKRVCVSDCLHWRRWSRYRLARLGPERSLTILLAFSGKAKPLIFPPWGINLATGFARTICQFLSIRQTGHSRLYNCGLRGNHNR